MTPGSADQTPSEQSREAPEPQRREDFGPLELLRTRKGDGRALLLFSHRREQGEP
jgi:hypothetical protein